MTEPAPIVGAPALALAIGATARQVDYWTRRGWIRTANTASGSGHPTAYEPAQVEHARIMARLVRAGVAPGAASVVAQRLTLVDHIELGDGITVGRDTR